MTALAKLPEKWRAAAQALRDNPSYYVEIRSRGVAAAYDNCADELTASLSPAELGGVDYRKIAHEIYCHVGQCHGEPMCFLAEDEGTQSRWIDAVQTVITYHISTPRADEAVTEEMVRIALDAYAKEHAEHDDRLPACVRTMNSMRAALTASLTPPSAKGE